MKTRKNVRLLVILGAAAALVAGTATEGRAQVMFDRLLLPNPGDPAEIAAGWDHTCARKFNGDVFCWGVNDVGQVGALSTTSCRDSEFPYTFRTCVDRPRFVLPGASQVTGGAIHTCALTGSMAQCWGSNASGQIGDNTLTQRSMPTPVATTLQFASIDAGTDASCGVTGSGEVACWGRLPYDPNRPAHLNSPRVPTTVFSHYGFRSVAVGNGYLCAQFNAWGWRETDCQGVNRVGQLGNDPSWMWKDQYGVPYAPVLIGTYFTPSAYRVVASIDFTCADMDNGTVQCAGSNAGGKLGNAYGGSSAFFGPPVGGGNGMALQGVTVGVSHACALDPSGRAYCWGSGPRGQLGTGNPAVTASALPVAVAGGHTFKAIAAGASHTCGIATNNSIYCWGDNSRGQLGIGYNPSGIDVSVNSFPVQYTSTPRRLDWF